MSSPVPILCLIHALGPGGSERQLAGLVRALDPSRFLPHVGIVAGGFRAAQLRAEGFPVIDVPLRSYLRRDTLAVIGGLRRYIRDKQIRLVHSFDFSTALLGVMAARRSGVPGLSSQRCYMDVVPPKYRALSFAAHWLGDGVVANSHALAGYLHDRWMYPRAWIDVCPNGLDAAAFCTEPRIRLDSVAGADLVIGTVAVFRIEKNLGQLIEAFARIHASAPGSRLLLVGEGPEEANLKALAARLGLNQACRFEPATLNVAAAMRSMDIFVLPSLSEGFPNALMEAMACGCPVVASRVGGCVELIEHGVHGLLATPADVDDLTSQLRALIDNPEGRRRMGQAAAERIRSDYSMAAAARRLEAIYTRHLR